MAVDCANLGLRTPHTYFRFTRPATTKLDTLSLHDALPIFTGTCYCVVQFRVGGLEADLDMIQPGIGERLHLGFGQSEARSDQVSVVTKLPGAANKLRQILANQRLTAGKTELGRPQGTPLLQDIQPLLGGEFLLLTGIIQWV